MYGIQVYGLSDLDRMVQPNYQQILFYIYRTRWYQKTFLSIGLYGSEKRIHCMNPQIFWTSKATESQRVRSSLNMHGPSWFKDTTSKCHWTILRLQAAKSTFISTPNKSILATWSEQPENTSRDTNCDSTSLTRGHQSFVKRASSNFREICFGFRRNMFFNIIWKHSSLFLTAPENVFEASIIKATGSIVVHC